MQHKFLITFQGGDVAVKILDTLERSDALQTLVTNAGLDMNQVASIDYLEPEGSPAEAQARKSRRRKSRADRFSEAISDVSSARETVEELRDELQNWRDSLPENLQSSSKADALDSAISELESVISDLEGAEGYSPEFPGMFG